ncbi:L,D-transpeptidase family protein [Peptococcaceae bacterium 1198_IL3148]
MNDVGIKAGKYILVNTFSKTLALYRGSRLVKTYNIALGKGAAPTGKYKIVNKIVNPGGVWGTRWLGLSVAQNNYGIHGTNVPSALGSAIGCIKMANGDIEQIFSLVNINTPVFVVAEKPKAIDDQPITQEQPLAITNDVDQGTEDLPEDLMAEPMAAAEPLMEELVGPELQPEPDPPAASPRGFYYQVIPGDTLWTIARRFGMPVQLLINSNSLENPNQIYPGQKIFIPQGKFSF